MLAKIYTGTKTFSKDGQTYSDPQYSVCHYDGGRRVRERCADLGKATERAKDVTDKLDKGQNEVLRLKSADATRYLDPLDLLKPLGVPLNLAVAEFVAARDALPNGQTLVEAAKFYAKRHPSRLEKRTVEQAVDEMLKPRPGRNAPQST